MEFLVHIAVLLLLPLGFLILKVTAVGMNGEELRKSGKRLREITKSLDISFVYKIVEIANIEETKNGLFTMRYGEALAVYASIILRCLLDDLGNLLNVLCLIKNLKPRIMGGKENHYLDSGHGVVSNERLEEFECYSIPAQVFISAF
ncbi:hypothetical protein SUGI_0375900 [Cryptomeria japonica]|nr:hypothetical protein SUGI_0375900 [Cryptomeria japonica]